MGYIKHEFVIAEVYDKAVVKKIKDLLNKSGISPSQRSIDGPFAHDLIQGPFRMINGATFFFMVPDGSKEGWVESARGDDIRSEFLKILKEGKYPSFLHAQFGGDDQTVVICETTDHEVANLSSATTARAEGVERG